jgi:hypothetical protein
MITKCKGDGNLLRLPLNSAARPRFDTPRAKTFGRARARVALLLSSRGARPAMPRGLKGETVCYHRAAAHAATGRTGAEAAQVQVPAAAAR